MAKVVKLVLVVSLAIGSGIVGCGGSTPPAQQPPAEPTPAGSEPLPGAGDEPTKRASISAQQCEANGGSVVGDIGDGAIHRPDYRCANGAKPTANISAPEGGPIAIEGSICCPR